jgi:signal transduction histidine kinase
MRALFLCSIFFVSSLVFSQKETEKEEALLKLTTTKNAVDSDSLFAVYIENQVFKDKEDYFKYTSKRFNELYTKKDTIKTLQMFNLLGASWIKNKKMDSVLRVKPIEPFLKETTPLALRAHIRYILYNYLESQGNQQEKAAENSKKSIEYFEKVNDSAYSAWGLIHGSRVVDGAKANDFEMIMDHAFSSIALLKYHKDEKRLVNLEAILATVYSLNYLFEPAAKLRSEAINYAQKNKDYRSLTIENLNAALDAKLQDKTAQQKEYLQKAIKYATLFNVPHFKFIAYHSNMVYAGQNGLLEEGKTYYNILEGLYPIFKGSTFHKILYLEAAAYLAYLKGDYEQAEKLGLNKLALAVNFNSKEIIQETHELLFLIYDAAGLKEKAKEQDNLILSYLNNTKQNALKNQLLYYQTIFETEKRDFKIQAQETDIALLDAKNKIKTQWLLFGGFGALFLIGFIWIVRSRNFARKNQELQENFTKDILKTQENERARIASELHDSIGQKLLILKNSFFGKEKEAKNEIDLVAETIKEVREMSHNLHPFQFEKLGLTTSLKNMVETFQKNSNVFYSEDIETKDGLIEKEHEIYVFRMLQEAMTNVEKHAAANACNLASIEEKNQLIFILKDNGKGFETSTHSEGLGMKTLQERARFINADLKIDSSLEKGTTITLKIQKK